MNRTRKIGIWMIALLLVLGTVFFAPKAEAAGQSITYKLTTLEGKTITQKTYGSTPQLLVFYDPGIKNNGTAEDVHSGDLVKSLVKADENGWIEELGLKVIMIGGKKNATRKQLNQFMSQFTNWHEFPEFLVETETNVDLMEEIFGTASPQLCCCALVKDGKVLAKGENYSDILHCVGLLKDHLQMDKYFQTVQTTVYQHYECAFQVLDWINEFRTGLQGIPALKIDKDLMAAAMQRAAELAAYCQQNTRPSGECFNSACKKARLEAVYADQIGTTATDDSSKWLRGYDDAALFWNMNGDTNKFIKKEYKTAGIGVVRVGKVSYWVVLLGDKVDTDAVAKKSDYKTSAAVKKNPTIQYSTILQGNKTIEVGIGSTKTELGTGKTAKIKLYVCNAEALNSKLKFLSSKSSVATVSDTGVITAVGTGTAYITIRSQYSNTKAPAPSLIRFKVVVKDKPAITTQPKNVTVAVGEKASFTVKATGGTLKYQWYYRKSASGSWTKVSSAAGTKATYTLTTQPRHNGYQYRCKVQNAQGYVYSKAVTLTLDPCELQPAITTQPQDAAVFAGEQATFAVKATGGGLSYQWYYRKTETGSWTAVSSAAGKKATYTLTTALRHDGYQYKCLVKNTVGEVYSDVVSLLLGPRIISEIAERELTVTVGEKVVLSVEAEGRELTYQWRYRKSEMDSAHDVKAADGKTASITITVEERHDGYRYGCIVSNAAGSCGCGSVTLRVSTGE
jgi:Cysteine-rich secretory protein family./Immunoglobulin I-set domain./Bacterial Ig-like domain (group 2).